MDTPKSSWLPAGLHQYVVDHSRPPDAVLVELAEVTARELGERAEESTPPRRATRPTSTSWPSACGRVG